MGTYNIVDTVLDVEGESGAGVLHHNHGAGGSAASRLETLLATRPLVLQKVHPKVRNHGEGPYNYHEGRAAIRHYANQPARPL